MHANAQVVDCSLQNCCCNAMATCSSPWGEEEIKVLLKKVYHIFLLLFDNILTPPYSVAMKHVFFLISCCSALKQWSCQYTQCDIGYWVRHTIYLWYSYTFVSWGLKCSKMLCSLDRLCSIMRVANNIMRVAKGKSSLHIYLIIIHLYSALTIILKRSCTSFYYMESWLVLYSYVHVSILVKKGT